MKDKIDTKGLYSIRLVNSPKNSRLIARWLLGIVIFVFSCLFLPWQQNVEGYGAITAFQQQQRPQTIQTLIAGRIESWRVQEGQFVHKGDTILMISEIKDKFFDPELLKRMNDQLKSKESSIASKRDKVVALEHQIQALRTGLKLSLSKAINKVQQTTLYITIDSMDMIAAKVDNEIAEAQFKRQEKLYNDGLVSLTNLEARKLKFQQTSAKYLSSVNKYSSSKNDYLNAQIELNSIRAEYLDKISKAESDMNATLSDVYDSEAALAKNRIDVSNITIRNNLYIIRAPQDGYLVKAMKHGLGETIKEGEEVATIMPDKPKLAVELYIKPMDLPLIHKGCKVRVQFDGWPAIVFSGWPGASVGTFGGIVQVVDYVNSTNGKFRVLVTPDPNDTPWPEQLRLGSGAMGWAMLNNVLLIYELWRQFNGFPPDFMKDNIPQAKSKDSKSTVSYDKDEEEK